ncbi:2-dehydro-3-deoxygluconokinase [Bacillaceae bacterium SAOS 7]|nr:2-dehydro-3-deoxygluconokinase [Bacillaceae bacterium SAOS 7]
MGRIVCFGEIMMRLNPSGNLRFLQADTFHVSYAGSEANVAVSLANLGLVSSFVSSVPDNEVGQGAIHSLRKFGVDTGFINRSGERLGIYFVEKGASQRPSKVIYDRKHSAIATAVLEDFHWDEIFQDAQWFHFSGITPALNENVAAICYEACKEAKRRNIKVSCDLNYRSKLWTKEQASNVMTRLMKYVDICIGNEEDAEKVFNIECGHSDEHFQSVDYDSYRSVAEILMEKFDFEMVALTLRESLSANRNLWSGLLYDGEHYHLSKKYDVNIVDRLGAGDSFAAGVIYSIINSFSGEKSINFAVAASCLKHTMEYDFNLSTVDEIENLMNGDEAGRVKR